MKEITSLRRRVTILYGKRAYTKTTTTAELKELIQKHESKREVIRTVVDKNTQRTNDNTTLKVPEQGTEAFLAGLHKYMNRKVQTHTRKAIEKKVTCPKPKESKSSPPFKRYTYTNYQDAAVKLCSPQTGVRRMLLVLGTGAGKTGIVSGIVQNFATRSNYPSRASKPPSRIIVLFRNEDLVNEFHNDIRFSPLLNEQSDVFQTPNTKEWVQTVFQDFKSSAKVSLTTIKTPLPVSRGYELDLYLLKFSTMANIMDDKKRANAILKNALIIMDEIQTISDPTGVSNAACEKKIPNLKNMTVYDIYGLIGLTATPFAKELNSFLDINNLMVLGHSKLGRFYYDSNARRRFLEKYTYTKRYDKQAKQIKSCALGENEAIVLNQERTRELYQEMTSRLQHYMFYYDISSRPDMFPSYTLTNVIIYPDAVQLRDTIYTAEASKQSTRKRTKHTKEKLITKKMERKAQRLSVFASANKIATVSKLNSIEDIYKLSHIIRPLMVNLLKRRGKAIIYSSYTPNSSTTFICRVLERLKVHSHDAVKNAEILTLSSTAADNIKKRNEIRNAFVASTHEGMESSILILPTKLGTGFDIKGGVRQMHIINTIPNRTFLKQIMGRPSRNCSHAVYGDDKDKWHIEYFHYFSVISDEEKAKLPLAPEVAENMACCDMAAAMMLLDSSNTFYFLDRVLKESSILCTLFCEETGIAKCVIKRAKATTSAVATVSANVNSQNTWLETLKHLIRTTVSRAKHKGRQITKALRR